MFLQGAEDDRVALVSAETRDVEAASSLSTLPPEWLVKPTSQLIKIILCV